jgi:hypothetical protein
MAGLGAPAGVGAGRRVRSARASRNPGIEYIRIGNESIVQAELFLQKWLRPRSACDKSAGRRRRLAAPVVDLGLTRCTVVRQNCRSLIGRGRA